MLRVALIAYLSLTTVLGPALCCCNARQLFSAVEGSECCAKCADALPSEQVPGPHEHDGRNCPCGKRHASLVAGFTGGAHSAAVEMQSLTWSVPVATSPALPEFDVRKAATIAHLRPADLYGREILRAYQILRC